MGLRGIRGVGVNLLGLRSRCQFVGARTGVGWHPTRLSGVEGLGYKGRWFQVVNFDQEFNLLGLRSRRQFVGTRTGVGWHPARLSGVEGNKRLWCQDVNLLGQE